MELDQKTMATLSAVATATLTTVLLKKGLRNVWLRGTKPLCPGQKRPVGQAFTLRFVPAREDLATPESWSSPISTRAAIESMAPGCIAVVGAMGITDAGIFGDILCARMKVRGVAEAFNLTNRGNYSSIMQRAYLVGTETNGVTPLVFQNAATVAAEGLNVQPFGTFTAAATGQSPERQIQLGVRVEF